MCRKVSKEFWHVIAVSLRSFVHASGFGHTHMIAVAKQTFFGFSTNNLNLLLLEKIHMYIHAHITRTYILMYIPG